MEIETAIQQYLVERKEAVPREQVERELAILARLQAYLEGDAAPGAAEAVPADDLRAFIRNWYREDEDVTPRSARALVAAVLGFASWLDRQLADLAHPPLVPALASLEESLPRAAGAAEALCRYARREDLAPKLEVETEDARSPLGLLTGGATHVIRPAEIDYARAEEDTFAVSEVRERSLVLRSPAREQLGEGPAGPVPVPPSVAQRLRVGDILHAEIAPTATGWEILHVETVYPGELDDRP